MYTKWFADLSSDDVKTVGGKNASLGEMIRTLKEKGVNVPDGFATTVDAYRDFISHNDLQERIESELGQYDEGSQSLEKTGRNVRRLFYRGEIPQDVKEDISKAYSELCERLGREDVDVAVRSSATAEDLPEASFAGQQETFLNVSGEEDVLDACRRCFASLFTDRAITYREERGFNHFKVGLSAGVQKMVRSDKACSGVMFTIDTETGFPDVVVINGAWGLGENVVQGTVNPDEFTVFKPLLKKENLKPIINRTVGDKEKKMVYATGGSRRTRNRDTSREERQSLVLEDEDVLTLAGWAVKIEEHYETAMDIEWARDGETDELFIVQARPETVQSQKSASVFKTYELKERGEKVATGLAVGEAVATGKVNLIKKVEDIDRFEEGGILVTEMTDPDWAPIMKKAAAIVTDRGGRTCHAAIVSRELGIPAVVGTSDATDEAEDGKEATVSCAEGDHGYLYKDELDFEEKEVEIDDLPETRTDIMINLASPASAFRWWRLPVRGVGLARMEFIVNNSIKIHPMALVNYDELEEDDEKKKIKKLTAGYEDKTEYFVDRLAEGVARLAAPWRPHPVIVRMSDFKTNEYAGLIGGERYEPREDNPMLGFRGASRYYSDRYREGFALECRAITKAREEIGLDNVVVMIPFCRTPEEADRVLEVMEENGLKRGENGLEVYVMCEVPSNVILADEFARKFDGFSIGSNDLTQLVLGVDRDSEELSDLFDERNEAVKRFVASLIDKARNVGVKVGICGQAPSDYPEFASFLVEKGIDSISLNPDSVIDVIKRVAETEAHIGSELTQEKRDEVLSES